MPENTPTGADPGVLATATRSAGLPPREKVLALADDLRVRWRRGDRPPVEAYLAADPALAADPDAALELIVAEAVAREEAGETLVTADYQARFPHLAPALARQFGVYRAVAGGSAPTGAATETGAEPAGPATFPFLAPPERSDEVGRLGPYRVLGVIGQGGMGVVFRAEDPALRRHVALKVMLPQHAASPAARTRFLREARAQAAVEHDHVAAIHQVGEDRGVPFIALPLLRGMTLSAALRANPRVPVPAAVRIAREMAEGLAAAHARRFVHRT